MGYLEDFKEQLEKNDFRKFFQLWEEYCMADAVDSDELEHVLKLIKKSDIAKTFGQYVETALPLWQLISDEETSYKILALLIDLQNTNSAVLGDLAYNAIEKRHSQDPDFQKRLRLVGLRTRENFQNAISAYELLAHLAKGKFVFHPGGWGAGEIVDVSPIREEVIVEFENLMGRKSLSFQNAFKAIIPLRNDHFLSLRFASPDTLEAEARKNPLEIVKLLLKGLGPKTAAEIKDELCEIVIPEKDWAKWWQTARSKLKKDTMVETPDNLRDPFVLRKRASTHEEIFQQELSEKKEPSAALLAIYNFVRDFPDMAKKENMRAFLLEHLHELLANPSLTTSQALQIQVFLEQQFGEKLKGKTLAEAIEHLSDIESLVNEVEILSFKKRLLVAIREHRRDWKELFLSFLCSLQQNTLRDYVLKELKGEESLPLLKKKLREILTHPATYPEVFIWYFQKIIEKEDVPFSDKQGQSEFLENFLILYNILESKPEYRDLIKKMYNILSGKRFLTVRNIIEGTSLEFIQEFLLLVSKCRTLSDHDKKVMRSLAEVVHPSLSVKEKRRYEENVLWTTEQGLLKTKERLQQLGTVEVVENAREIEAARAHGDLRENSEYKFALERRSRLQSELKVLSEQLNRARVITKEDISQKEISIGCKVGLLNERGELSQYVILGPWDADPDQNILSMHSKLSESMLGKKLGDKVVFRDEEFRVTSIGSYLD